MKFYVQVTNPVGCTYYDGRREPLNHRLLFGKEGLLTYDSQLFDSPVKNEQLTQAQAKQLLQLVGTVATGEYQGFTWSREA